MLDAPAYRASETAAKRTIASWRLSNINDPYIFQNQGFPVRADSVLDLAQILDTMQEERFDFFMGEVGGFTDEEANFFADVCIDYINFYQKTFESDCVIIPLSTMIAHYVIYRKLFGYNSKFSRLLEIGPGCGYLSFFLRHHAPLEDYSQVESTESFYLLQSHINSHVFGSRFREHTTWRQAPRDHNFYVAKMRWHGDFHYEAQKFLDVPRTPVCNHYPWWRLGDVAEKRFDIVTANANLNEFSREALFQYLSVIRDVLADDGAIIAQCLGGGAPTYDSVFANMKSAGFVPVALVAGDADPGRLFVVSNGVFVGKKHPLYAKYAERTPVFPMWDRKLDFINRLYFINEEMPGNKRILSIADILALIKERLKGPPQPPSNVPPPNSAPNTWPVSHQKAEEGSSDTKASDADALRKLTTSMRRIETGRLRMINAIEVGRIGSGEDLAVELLKLTAQKESMERRVHQLAAELESVRNSTSWRVTAPLRAMPSGPKHVIKRCARVARTVISPILSTGARGQNN